MIQFLKNIWNAQRNAAQCEKVFDHIQALHKEARESLDFNNDLSSQLRSAHARSIRAEEEARRITFERNQYSALTATLASEYYQSIGSPKEGIPDSIKEAYMLRGVATNWINADDVRIGKPMWDKRQKQEGKRLEIDVDARAKGAVFIPMDKFPIHPTPEFDGREYGLDDDEWSDLQKAKEGRL